MREKICFGGTFNPIHHGHLICARAAAEAMGAKRVVLIPNGVPGHRVDASGLATADDRLMMCRLAAAGIDGFEIDDRECKRAGATYTIDTARELKREGWAEIDWLIGADMFNTLPTWREADALLREVRFIIMARPGHKFAWDALPPEVRKLERNIVQVPQIDISATEIRGRVGKGLSIDYLCPPRVCRYIAENGLYRAQAG